jgi:hypothetical protein
MCVIVQKKYIPLVLLREKRSAKLHVNMLKDNIKIDINERAIMIKRPENNLINTYSEYNHFL